MATIKALIVNTDGTFRETEIENSLGSFQAVVGGYIEGVFGEEATIYVDEDGRVKTLPINLLASLFAQRVLHCAAPLYGTALIVGPSDGSGNDTHVRQSVVDYYTMEV